MMSACESWQGSWVSGSTDEGESSDLNLSGRCGVGAGSKDPSGQAGTRGTLLGVIGGREGGWR